jgi:hypothetical protein
MDDRERYLRQADLAPAGYYPGARSVEWLKSSPPVIGINRPLRVPPTSNHKTPGTAAFDRRNCRDGDK